MLRRRWILFSVFLLKKFPTATENQVYIQTRGGPNDLQVAFYSAIYKNWETMPHKMNFDFISTFLQNLGRFRYYHTLKLS